MGAGDILKCSDPWKMNCAVAMNQLQTQSVGDVWTSWTPTYGGGASLTFGTVTTHYAKYFQVGKRVFFQIAATGTTGGVTDPNISFTLPVTAANADALNFSAWVVDTGNPIGATARGPSTTKVYVAKYDYSNWGLGASRRINVSGCYEAA